MSRRLSTSLTRRTLKFSLTVSLVSVILPEEEWDEVININLHAVFIQCQLTGRIMLKKRYGKIINVGSMCCFFGGQTIPAYTAAKGGVMQLAKELSNDWFARGVNVNCIAPGYMATDMNEALLANETRFAQISARIPVSRWGTGADMKGTALFLSSHASQIT